MLLFYQFCNSHWLTTASDMHRGKVFMWTMDEAQYSRIWLELGVQLLVGFG